MSSNSLQNAFVPGFKYDVFVSYAQVDDEPYIDSKPGWVTSLVQNLSKELARKLGGRENFKLWMDRKQEDGLSGNKPIQEKIQGTLEGTAIMVVIMSPAYLKREWCQLELAAFSDTIQKVKLSNGRIFIVEREDVSQSERPKQLQNLRGYRFWTDRQGEGQRTLGIPVPSAEERQYWDELAGLSIELAKELGEIKGAVKERLSPGDAAVPSSVAGDDRPVVFLAEATDDLYRVRRQVVDYLDQAGLRVVPAASEHYPFEEDQFRAAVERDLAASNTICVQLLSDVPGRSQKYVAIQNEMATASGKTILQWRHRDLNLSEVEEKDLRDLLDGETVLAVGIEEFKKTVLEKAQSAAKAPDDVPGTSAFIRVSASGEDTAMLKGISDVLARNHIFYDAGEMDDLQEELKHVFENCDGLLITYGKASVKEVEKRLRACLTQMFRHKKKPLLAVYQAPKDKIPPGISMPGLRILKGEEQVSDHDLSAFIKDLRNTATKTAVADA